METAVMTPASPYEVRPVQSFIGEFVESCGRHDMAVEFQLCAFEVKANSVERTFVDKVFAICDYYLAGEIPSRQSRHIYDLFKLQSLIALDEDLVSLLAMVRGQRKGNFRCPSADDGVSLADTIDAICKEEPYRKDYERVTAPLLYEDVSYDVASQVLAGIASFLREYGV